MLKISEFWKNRKVRILLLIEILLLLFGIVGLFGKSGVCVDRGQTEVLIHEGVALPAGVYTLKVYYEAEGSIQGRVQGSCGVEAEDAMYKTLLFNEVPLYEGLTRQECEFRLRESVRNLKAVINVSENVNIQGLEVIATNKGSMVYLFWTIIVCGIVNAVVFFGMYQRKHPISVEKQLVIWGIPLITLLVSLPIMVDYNIVGDNLLFHMERIEALTQSIVNGELSSRIPSMWLSGHGYASSIFCGDTGLVIPALLRIIGMSMDSAYRIYLFSLNLATALLSYVCFSRCFQNRYIGILGCALYTLAPYRIYILYQSAAIDEAGAMLFLPLLVWGIYRIYTEKEKVGYWENVLILVIGFSGVLQSHVPICLAVVGFVLLNCLLLWKKTFRKHTFGVLAVSAIATILVNAWFWIPYVDLLMADDYYLHSANVMIQDKGILPAQIFYTLQAALLFCLFLWIFIRNKKCECEGNQGQEKGAGDIGLGLTLLALFLCTGYFPWNFLGANNKVFTLYNILLQSPVKMMAITTVLAVFVACVAGKHLLQRKNEFLSGNIVIVLILLMAVIFSNYQVNDILLNQGQILRVYTVRNLGTDEVGAAEYLPLGTDITHMSYHAPVLSEGVIMSDYRKDGLTAEAYVEVQTDGAYIELPMLYYKGYQAKAVESEEMLQVIRGENGDVRVQLTEGLTGGIRVWYAGMWYWHVAEAVSVITGSVLLLYGITRKGLLKKNNKAIM